MRSMFTLWPVGLREIVFKGMVYTLMGQERIASTNTIVYRYTGTQVYTDHLISTPNLSTNVCRTCS